MTTHLEKNKRRIARVREEYLAAAKPKERKEIHERLAIRLLFNPATGECKRLGSERIVSDESYPEDVLIS